MTHYKWYDYKHAHTRERERERERERDRDRQTDRQTDRDRETETDRQADRQRQTGRQTETDRQTERKPLTALSSQQREILISASTVPQGGNASLRKPAGSTPNFFPRCVGLHAQALPLKWPIIKPEVS